MSKTFSFRSSGPNSRDTGAGFRSRKPLTKSGNGSENVAEAPAGVESAARPRRAEKPGLTDLTEDTVRYLPSRPGQWVMDSGNSRGLQRN